MKVVPRSNGPTMNDGRRSDSPEGAWPAAGQALLQELAKSPGRLALTVDDSSGSTVAAFAELLGLGPVSVGRTVTRGDLPATTDALVAMLSGAQLLVDLDVLFWQPWLRLDPIAVLRTIVRRGGPVVSEWPGTAIGRTVTYSMPGRRDYYRATLEDAVILRPRDRVYPDELPYTLERM
jgi:hypothetical protein